MKVLCITNKPRTFPDGSTDESDQYLTVGKVYDSSNTSKDGKNLFIEVSDKGGFPHGHKWWNSNRFKNIDEVRQKKLNDLGI